MLTLTLPLFLACDGCGLGGDDDDDDDDDSTESEFGDCQEEVFNPGLLDPESEDYRSDIDAALKNCDDQQEGRFDCSGVGDYESEEWCNCVVPFYQQACECASSICSDHPVCGEYDVIMFENNCGRYY
ncbi:MAG: hypothetical protein M5R36_24105 [Deltaproteobacteria bacterium]|nr:hypothetical protein [Deltaproteobacteria bacterium]